MTFRPYTKEDKLEVGTKIRLAGREGEIENFDTEEYPESDGEYVNWSTHLVKWRGCKNQCFIDLRFFDFEIEDIPPPPLTIDKRVKEELINRFGKEFPSYAKDNEFVDFLNSLEEV